MTLDDNIKQAIVAELTRQSEAGERPLKVSTDDAAVLTIEGQVDLDDLAMVIVGALAGGS
jgi:hypothetical protein